MNRNQSFVNALRPVRALAFVALVIAGAMVAAIALGGRGGVKAVEPGASAPPAPAASPIVTPKPSLPAVTPEPNAGGGGDAMPIKVDLENATGADVYVDIVDETGSLVDAASGTPGDGASVEAYTLEIEIPAVDLPRTNLVRTWLHSGAVNGIDRFRHERARTDAGIDRPASRPRSFMPFPVTGIDCQPGGRRGTTSAAA